jgi:hypothetical protein
MDFPGLKSETWDTQRMGFVVSRVPKCKGVQFHDILYTLSLDMLYTSAQAQACAEV